MKTIESIYRFLTCNLKKKTKQTTIKYLCVQSPTIANLNSVLFTLNQSKVLITFLILFKPMKYMFRHYDDDLKI